MDDRRFDSLTRALAEGASRRTVLKGVLGGLVGVAALGGASKVSAQDPEEEVLDQPTGAAEEPPPDPPVEEPPQDPPADTPAEEPAQESLTETAEEGTPADAAEPAVVCPEGSTPCETLCCDPGWRCCGVYCIPDREGSCCSDAECSVCDICSLDGVCFPVCDEVGLTCCVNEVQQTWTCAECCRDDPDCFDIVDCDFCESIGLQCCIDEHKHTVSCANCCDDRDCANWGDCHKCYGGYCLSCFDQTDGRAPICAPDQCSIEVSAGHDEGGFCVQCCVDEQCGPCERCHQGWCEFVCDKDELCCSAEVEATELINGGYCAHCCSHEDCGGCERCDRGHCNYGCDEDETCCHGEFCAPDHEGCCGLSGDWCDREIVNAADAILNGTCCKDLHCCYDDKTKSGTCAECCDDNDCEGVCCGGVCQPHCCSDKDCREGVCAEGHCVECRENHDCGRGKICCDGTCFPDYQCCFENAPDPVNCGDCETCNEGFCRPTGVGLYGACFPMIVGIAEDSPQLNCCDGLVCCETKKYGLVCLECCNDHDCAHGCNCEDGFCSCACSSDKDCPKDTCCCKNGTCSHHCCKDDHDKPDKPGTSVGGESVSTLPSTGAGDSQSGAGWLGAAALGAAAAYIAGKKLREETSSAEPVEE